MAKDEDTMQTTAKQDNIVALAPRTDGGWTQERIELVKRTIVPKGIGNDEFALFIEQCKRSGLDPLLKEAFCVARRANVGDRDRPQWVTKYEFQPSEAGMLSRAERFPDYRGVAASAVFAQDDILVDMGAGTVQHRFNPAQRKGSLVGAWARCVREGKLPVVVWLDFAGYVQQSPLWSKIPTTMIEKCARVAVLRKAYPEAFGGLYVKEELPADYFDGEAPTPGGGHSIEREAPPPPPLSQQQLPAERKAATVESLPAERQRELAEHPAVKAVEQATGGRAEQVRTAAAAQGGAVVVAFGPHKGKPARDLSDDELSECVELAQEKLLEQPDAKWARAMWENLAALEAETKRRFRGLATAPPAPGVTVTLGRFEGRDVTTLTDRELAEEVENFENRESAPDVQAARLGNGKAPEWLPRFDFTMGALHAETQRRLEAAAGEAPAREPGEEG